MTGYDDLAERLQAVADGSTSGLRGAAQCCRRRRRAGPTATSSPPGVAVEKPSPLVPRRRCSVGRRGLRYSRDATAPGGGGATLDGVRAANDQSVDRVDEQPQAPRRPLKSSASWEVDLVVGVTSTGSVALATIGLSAIEGPTVALSSAIWAAVSAPEPDHRCGHVADRVVRRVEGRSRRPRRRRVGDQIQVRVDRRHHPAVSVGSARRRCASSARRGCRGRRSAPDALAGLRRVSSSKVSSTCRSRRGGRRTPPTFDQHLRVKK